MKHVAILALRQERERRGWSRNYVAEQVGVDVITVGRWERGERMPHPQLRQKLCALFEMNAQDLGLVSILSQEPDDAATITDLSSKESDAITAVPNPSKEPDTITVTPDLSQEKPKKSLQESFQEPSQESSLKMTKALKVSSSSFFHRRKILLAGLGGLGMIALAGSSLLSAARSPSVPAPISMPLSKRSHQLLDPNTDNYINYMAWSPDSKTVALANGSNVVSIWNIEKDTCVLYYPTLNGWVNDISWSKANNIIAAATADKYAGSLQLWKFPDEKPIFTLQRPYGLRSASWSTNGKYLALSGRTPIVEVWNPFTSEQIGHYSASDLGPLGLGIRRVKWSASGTLLACGADDGTIHVWEALTNKPKIICRGHKSRVIDLVWSPDERHIASASADKTSKIWEVSSGRAVFTYRGHAGEVEGVDWFPRGNYIASGSADRTAHVWEPFTGKLVAKYEGHSSMVETVLWSVDGSTLAIGTEKEGVEIWQAPL